MTSIAPGSELLSLSDRVALVTGGAGGIGSAIVHTLLAAGAKVASADLPGTTHVDGASALECDLRDPAAPAAMFAAFRHEFDRLDVLVHCAGVARDGVLWKMSAAAWDEVLQVNLGSAFAVLSEAVPLMRQTEDGAVVLISSINGERGKFGQANYVASKAGLIGLARTAARELGAFGIRVNVVAPGMIHTAMTGTLTEEVRGQALKEIVLGRIGQPQDVARAVWFLASSMSSHVTGQVLRVDGGQLIC